jgi:excisionase family DNA binding protein
MVLIISQISPVIVNNHISVKTAAEFSSYSLQYLRRLLRFGKIDGLKIGQVWLIEKDSLENYLNQAFKSSDQRFRPK